MTSNEKTLATWHARIETEASAANAQSPARLLLRGLIDGNVILLEEWEALDAAARHRVLEVSDRDELLAVLVETQLLTEYQAGRVLASGIRHLVFGNYRILERVGVGGMGVVYRGEHILMRRPVAIKVLQASADDEGVLLRRFSSEMRVLAKIRHPNIVVALDAGCRKPTEHETDGDHYLVMEYIVGTSLEDLPAKGPLSVTRACELIYQVAGALAETHRRNLIHRDIKPSNIIVSQDGVAKLLDFGLAVHFGWRRHTNPGTLLGTLSYMAPEQAADSTNVDVRADIFGLGATLYYALTAKPPFLAQGNLTQQVARRLTQPAPSLRSHRPDVSTELDAVVLRMMAHNREERYPTPQSVMRALLPHVNASQHVGSQHCKSDPFICLPDFEPVVRMAPMTARILVVDDEAPMRTMCKAFLRQENIEYREAGDGATALRMLAERPVDLVLLDIDMPGLSGAETLRRLRAQPPCNNLRIIMMSGGVSSDDLAQMLALGADDYLAKPFSRQELVARVKAAFQHKATRDRSEQLNQQLLSLNADLEQTLIARHSDLIQARNALMFALAKIVSSRSQETTAHLTRMAKYVGKLARRARQTPRLAPTLGQPFVRTLEACTFLHDIGNIAMPDHILQRTGRLDLEDRIILQAHTTIGAETLSSVAKRDRSAAAFWQMAIEIARHHHEHFDGSGYPDQLAGSDIPLSARIVAVADAYDTLRAPGGQGIVMSHNAAVELIVEGPRGRFDPLLVQAFKHCEADMENIFRSAPDDDQAFLVSCTGDDRLANANAEF